MPVVTITGCDQYVTFSSETAYTCAGTSEVVPLSATGGGGIRPLAAATSITAAASATDVPTAAVTGSLLGEGVGPVDVPKSSSLVTSVTTAATLASMMRRNLIYSSAIDRRVPMSLPRQLLPEWQPERHRPEKFEMMDFGVDIETNIEPSVPGAASAAMTISSVDLVNVSDSISDSAAASMSGSISMSSLTTTSVTVMSIPTTPNMDSMPQVTDSTSGQSSSLSTTPTISDISITAISDTDSPTQSTDAIDTGNNVSTNTDMSIVSAMSDISALSQVSESITKPNTYGSMTMTPSEMSTPSQEPSVGMLRNAAMRIVSPVPDMASSTQPSPGMASDTPNIGTSATLAATPSLSASMADTSAESISMASDTAAQTISELAIPSMSDLSTTTMPAPPMATSPEAAAPTTSNSATTEVLESAMPTELSVPMPVASDPSAPMMSGSMAGQAAASGTVTAIPTANSATSELPMRAAKIALPQPTRWYAAPWYQLTGSYGAQPTNVRGMTCHGGVEPPEACLKAGTGYCGCEIDEEVWSVVSFTETSTGTTSVSYDGPVVITASGVTLTTSVSFDGVLTTTSETIIGRIVKSTVMASSISDNVTVYATQTTYPSVTMTMLPGDGATRQGFASKGAADVAASQDNPAAVTDSTGVSATSDDSGTQTGIEGTTFVTSTVATETVTVLPTDDAAAAGSQPTEPTIAPIPALSDDAAPTIGT